MLDPLLSCPRCRVAPVREGGALRCHGCGSRYQVHEDKIPIYDLFVDPDPNAQGRDPEQSWRCEDFESDYERIGYHENGVEFDRRLGHPEAVSRFHFERVTKRLLEWIEPGPEHAVLDVGCGAGYFLHLIRRRYEAAGWEPRLAGVDISRAQLPYLVRRTQQEEVSDALAVRGNAERLPFADASFDLVTCSEVLEHIRTPSRALREMHRVLKPGGTLLLSTPSRTAERGWNIVLAPAVVVVKLVNRGRRHGQEGHSTYDVPWRPRELAASVRGAGLEIREFRRTGVMPHPYYFTYLPPWLVGPAVAVFERLDRHSGTALRPLASHLLLRASRPMAA
jgi:SAM-dependent methyltransferase